MLPKFNLQAVLDYHHHRVKLLEMELGRLRQDAHNVQLQINECHRQRQSLFDESWLPPNQALDLDQALRLRQNIQQVERRLLQYEHAQADLSRRIAAHLEKVVAARQDEATLKKLKDKELEAYLIELARREQSQRDDIYIAQAFRKTQATGSPKH